MKKAVLGLFIVTAMAGSAMSANIVEKKVEKLVQSVQDGCKKELDSYCKEVTPGEGRVLACLYAFSDKLSGQCEYALYDAAAQLQQAIVKMVYVANECENDLAKFCANVTPGDGAIINCLTKNQKSLEPRCDQAVKDTIPK